MSKKINTINPESLIYENELLKLTVLGGIKLDGLDRMRVTVKIELKDTSLPAIRHNLDLYNGTQLEKLIRKTAERLEIGTSIIAAVLSELTEQLEQYRLEQIKHKQPEIPQSPKLTAKQVAAATELLSSKGLLEATNELIGKSGMIGEVDNRLLMFLIFTSRKREQPLHVVSLGASGTGKTHLQEKIGDLIPEEDKIEITTLSENAFYYFGQRELKNKLILIEDLDGADNVMYPLRELQSKKKITKTVAHKNTKGETKTMTLTVEGPVSVAGCTTKEKIYEDNSNRSFLIYLDESPEQDQRIMDYQRAISAGTVNTVQEEKAAELLRNSQRLLEPIKVVNRYAEYLLLPKEVFKPRRTNTHYLQFIEAITFYCQRQRQSKVNKETGELYIETTIEDIENANQLLKQTLLRKSDSLTGASRNHFEKLKLYLIGEQKKQFTNQSISKLFRIPLTTIKRYHLDLNINGYLKKHKQKGSKAYHYEVVSYEEFQELQNSINSVLDTTLTQLKERLSASDKPNSSQQPTTKTEPIKTSDNKRKATIAQ